jgi:cell division protein FtsW
MAYRTSSDRVLFTTTSLLTIFGLVMVYSASSVVAASQFGLSSYFFLRQLLWALGGYCALILLMNFDYRRLQKPTVVRACLALALLGLFLVMLQPKVNGAHRWLRWGMLSFQPSEIAKLVAMVFLAGFLQKREKDINRFWNCLARCLVVVGLVAALIVVEPDLGQAVCLILIAGIVLFVAGLDWRYIAGAVAAAVPLLYVFVIRVPFRWERVKSFLDPSQDPLGSGWQVLQSLTAVGSGGFLGAGLGQGKQKLFFLPEAHSDFIFAVIGEEIGLVGTCIVAVAFLVFFYRGMRIALRAPDRFGFYLGLSITLMVAIQAFINISMVLALMPTKGIALPFISQGGSSLLLNLFATGILLNISHYADMERSEAYVTA